MSEEQFHFEWWRSKARAVELGATNHARLFGVVPGFWNNDIGLWVGRSDALNWLEDLLGFINESIWASKGEDPMFAISIGRPIEVTQ